MLNTEGPTALICSRQNLPIIDRTKYPPASMLHKGAYVLSDPEAGEPEIILMATGSEVWRMMKAAEQLAEQGVQVRTVSFPSWELFEQQPEDYRDAVLPPQVKKRVSVEAASPFGWCRYTGDEGRAIGLERFGASAPGEEVLDKLGFAVEDIVKAALELLGKQ